MSAKSNKKAVKEEKVKEVKEETKTTEKEPAKKVKRANAKNIMEKLQNHFFDFVKLVMEKNSDKSKVEDTCGDLWTDFKVNVDKDVKYLQKSVTRPFKQPKDKNAPTKRRSAYIFYCMDQRADLMKVHPEYKVTQVSVELGARWKKLTDEEKKPFQEKSLADKERYTDEMDSYVKPDGTVSKPKKKRGSSAYNVFCAEKRPRVKKNNEDKQPKEITKILSAMWKEVSEETKKKYKKLAEEKRKNLDVGSDADDESEKKKKTITGYSLFTKEIKPEVKKENSKLKDKGVMELVAKKWSNLSEPKKKEYNLKANKMKKSE